MRRYDELVQVRTGSSAGSPVDVLVPAFFVWRDRLYVVRAVLAHWYERRVWWREAAACALLGLRADQQVRADRQIPGGRATDRSEREVWRVEASAGRSSPIGVYDLARDPDVLGRLHSRDAWRLVRLDD